jgi:hypothetical protein
MVISLPVRPSPGGLRHLSSWRARGIEEAPEPRAFAKLETAGSAEEPTLLGRPIDGRHLGCSGSHFLSRGGA